MLQSTPVGLRIAINRITFGARDVDVTAAQQNGWVAWIDEQLAPPPGDDPTVAAHLANQTLYIKYAAPAENDTRGEWNAVDESRPLNYLSANVMALWHTTRTAGTATSPQERTRIRQELAAATWIRNTHSKYQVREFMVDFWHNHFNIGKVENQLATAMLPAYDREAIRPHALGNFRQLLEATAKSPGMLIYLDNWVSQAGTPNENYAREIMELHTLGGAAYLGTGTAPVAKDVTGIAVGFTDQDIIQASRALSGWTIQYGQRGEGARVYADDGLFVFNPRQHNRNVTSVLGVNLANESNDIAQGLKLLDILAAHPATATHIVTKLARRMFGDTPPQAVIDRGVAAWKAHAGESNQIARVVRAMTVEGPEIISVAPAKVRRPYERLIAMARTTNMVVTAATYMTNLLDPLNDGLFAWQAPNGRPDVDRFWLATGAMVSTWNLIFQMPNFKELASSPLTNQSPLEALNSAFTTVDFWVEQMVGHNLSEPAMTALYQDQGGSNGVPAAVRSGNANRIENAHRRLISLIATSEEFALR